ncbi:MAG TPA: DUF3108 domain-containing protein [Xanthomonadaceae bacterium]|nr:DUF3108 domain-containing protein [Xanthomonadaceae bacterium]
MNTRASFAFAAAALLALASLPAFAALKPFSADYSASYMGLQGNARMTLAPSGVHRWRYTLDVKSAVAQLSQSTLFEEAEGGWRPLSGRDASSVLIKKSDKQASYDWAAGEASWSGDVKPERRGPVALKAGDLDAMLLNLAIVRDVQAGKSSRTYRMVDDGRAKSMSYRVVGEDTVSFGGKPHPATRVSVPDGSRETVLWVAEDVPVPVRILRRHKGEDEMDLKLLSID